MLFILIFKKYKTFSVLIYSYINTSGNWKNEKLCDSRSQLVNLQTLHQTRQRNPICQPRKQSPAIRPPKHTRSHKQTPIKYLVRQALLRLSRTTIPKSFKVFMKWLGIFSKIGPVI